MNTAQKEQIRQHRMEGVTYEKIAVCLGLSVNTVKSFCQRNQLGGRKQHTSAKHTCKQCGVEVKQLSHRKEKKFCSDKCRLTCGILIRKKCSIVLPKRWFVRCAEILFQPIPAKTANIVPVPVMENQKQEVCH